MEYILTYSLYIVILSVLMGISTWKLFQKMGYSPLFAFIPFYNYFIILKEAKQPKWWVIFTYFPIVGTIMISVFHLFLMKKFGKNSFSQKLLTVVLPFIYMAKINYASDTELVEEDIDEEDENKKESIIGSLAYATVFATIIHTFILQPFTIPTGSMERTLLVGDFLVVNRMSYGVRLPMRPISIPFLQSTIFDKGKDGNPKNDPKSYVESVQLPYWRLPGFGKVERNDIVVFNYPEDSVHISIDRKDPYVKRAVAVAGDVLELKEGKLYINGKPEQKKGDAEVQQSYWVVASSPLDIPQLYEKYGFLSLQEGQNQSGFIYYFSGLTNRLAREIKKLPEVISIEPMVDGLGRGEKGIFGGEVKDWNKDWFGPLRIPKRGDVLQVNKETLLLYKKLIEDYEGNKLEVKEGKILINGEETNQYNVKLDYYFMMGDNRDASLDSRYFGFVPETYVIGSPLFTWLSVEGLFTDNNSSYQANGKKIRWDRMFKLTNTGETSKTSYWWVAVILLTLFFGGDYIAKIFKKKDKEEI